MDEQVKQKEKISELKGAILKNTLVAVFSIAVAVGMIYFVAIAFIESMAAGLFLFAIDAVLFIVGLVNVGFRQSRKEELISVTNSWSEYEKLLENRREQARIDEERHEAMVQRELEEKREEEKRRELAEHPVCPMCGSKNTNRISTLNRAVSVGTLGLASSKIGKQYECKNCKHKW